MRCGLLFSLYLLGLLKTTQGFNTFPVPVAFNPAPLSLRQQLSKALFAEKSTSDSEEPHAAETNHTEGLQEPFLPSEAQTDILSSPAFLKRKIDVLKGDIAKAEERIEAAKTALEVGRAEWGDKLEALEKENLNIQDRMLALARDGSGKASVEVARVIVEALDDYDRAFATITPENDEEREVEAAFKDIYKKIMDTFEEMGVKEIESVGKEFDYEVHNAVMVKPSEEYDEGIVCEELQKGFVLGDDLIRAAAVVVAS